ncbi:MAG TPA: BatD family protein [Phycisphaerae bacterium]|nr:BatD family protein [Phycisphaerae bacterium]HOJ73366.1 BatD family protein [Phycisphaerae bacterium]HOM50975.1 BatD family protein [Phycisphaerae bacterium]HPU26431.1 BatD family protein [Phycisphaerae bacterium]
MSDMDRHEQGGGWKSGPPRAGATLAWRTPTGPGMRPRLWAVWAVLGLLVTASGAGAANVQVNVSSRETVVGVPIVMQIAIESTGAEPPPQLPEIPDVKVRSRGGPMRSSQTTIINGVVESKTTLTYEYELTPMREGRIVIPAFEVTADGQVHQTSPISIVVSKSETEDLLFVEVQGDRGKLYVGESLQVKLQIWLRPFVDRNYGRLAAASMWSCINLERSEWGIFREPLEQMLARRAEPRGREVLRKDSQGQERAYYLYEIERTIEVNRPGPLTAEDINIVVTYPTRLGRSNDIFSMGRLMMTSSMPLAAQATVAPIEVLPLPVEGKPAWFSGAVGRYTIEASAKPTEVAVGDPITLTLRIDGDGNLQELQPPPLAELPELTERFRVPSEPLAGEVGSDGKRFSVSIRAVSDDVASIPPIPFAFFDPREEKYVTVYTESIPLKVTPADKLAVSQIVDSTGNRQAVGRLTESAGGILANYTGMREVLTPQDVRWGPLTWMALVLPPIGFVVCWMVQSRSHRLRTDVGFARRRRAKRDAVARLRSANSTRDAAGAVSLALGQYVADRCNLPSGGMTRAAVVSELQARAVNEELVREIDALLAECEAIHYAGSGTRSPEELRNAALRCIDRLEREKLDAGSRRKSAVTSGVVGGLFVAVLFAGAPVTVRAEPLTLEQQVEILNQGLRAFDEAAQLRQKNPTQAGVLFREAQAKFQLLVDSGVRNGKLYYNLGNACLESGQLGRAILNYRRAQTLIPDDPRLAANLRYARSLRRNQIAESGEQAFLRTLFFWHFGTSLHHRFAAGLVVYVCFWALLIARTFMPRLAWRYALVPVGLTCLLLGASVAVSLATESSSRAGVILAENVTVRKGNGEGFEPQFKEPLHEGVEFELVERRAEWLHIRLPDGKTGWIRERDAEMI